MLLPLPRARAMLTAAFLCGSLAACGDHAHEPSLQRQPSTQPATLRFFASSADAPVGSQISLSLSGTTAGGTPVLAIDGWLRFSPEALRFAGKAAHSTTTIAANDSGAVRGRIRMLAVRPARLEPDNPLLVFEVLRADYLSNLTFEPLAVVGAMGQLQQANDVRRAEVRGSLQVPAAVWVAAKHRHVLGKLLIPTIYGDADGSGAVDQADADLVGDWIVGNSAPPDSVTFNIANVAPQNLPGIGGPTDDDPPGWGFLFPGGGFIRQAGLVDPPISQGCDRALAVDDLLLIAQEAGGTDVEVPGEVMPAGSQRPSRCSTIPPQSPDTDPDAEFYSNSALHSPTSPSSGVLVIRPLVNIVFLPGATLQQREAAINLVGGTVVGGSRITQSDGYYVVQIPDPGTIDSLETIISTLMSQPGVETALPEYILPDMSSYRIPVDGPGFAKADWSVLRTDPRAGIWTVPHVQANLPLAWGCATGSSETRMAVVDEGLTLPTGSQELTPTIGFRINTNLGSAGSAHGTAVASILAARGGNGTGIAGVMWDADLRLYDIVSLTASGQVIQGPGGGPTWTMRGVANRVARAAWDGAQVINMSLSMNWAPNVLSRDDSAVARRFGVELARVLRPYTSTSRPVLVVSAGNMGFDAWWGGTPQVADSFPEHVIVVAASNRALNNLSVPGVFTSNTGPLVQLAAPGDSVLALTQSAGNTRILHATSAAAPLVSGAIGLVLSFDPRLTPREALALVRAGATRSGTSVGGVSLLDSREALALAAEQSGAPLCGNWVRWDNATLLARRSAGYETIGPWPLSNSLFIAEHDGRIVSRPAGGRNCRPGLEWSASGGWQVSSSTSVYPCSTSPVLFLSRVSHDRDSSVLVTPRDDASAFEVRLFDNPDQQGLGSIIASISADVLNSSAIGIWAPSGGDVFVLLAAISGGVQTSATVYRVDRRTGSVATERTWANEGIWHSTMSLSDDRRHFILGVARVAQGYCAQRLYSYPSWTLVEEVPTGCNAPDLGQRFAPAPIRRGATSR